MPMGIVMCLNQRNNHHPHQMAVVMDLKLTALPRHRPPLTQEAIGMQITTAMVEAAAQIVVQAVVAAIAVVAIVVAVVVVII
jgi:hypothetical protein